MTVDELFSLGLRLNSNIRCIEMGELEFLTNMGLALNSNIRCIEITPAGHYWHDYIRLNSNIRCIEIDIQLSRLINSFYKSLRLHQNKKIKRIKNI